MYIHFISADYDIAQNISHAASDGFVLHTHPYYELHYFVRGDVEFAYAGEVIRLQPHSLTLVNCNVPHGIRVLTEQDYERYTVHFTREMVPPHLREQLLDMFRGTGTGIAGNHVRRLGATNIHRSLKELVQLHVLPEEQRDLLAPPMIVALLICVMMAVGHAPLAETEKEGRSLTSEKVIEFINAHLTEPLTLSDMARAFYCSKNYLNSLFKRETGSTVMNYVQLRRLHYARMLIENGYPVTKACTMAGFSEYSSFFRAYVKHFGASPSSAAQPRRSVPDGTEPEHPARDGEAIQRQFIWQLRGHDMPDDHLFVLHDQ
ncbi:MAG: AraC family transcriptional regulator [Aristaeellaceae bacterium]